MIPRNFLKTVSLEYKSQTKIKLQPLQQLLFLLQAWNRKRDECVVAFTVINDNNNLLQSVSSSLKADVKYND